MKFWLLALAGLLASAPTHVCAQSTPDKIPGILSAYPNSTTTGQTTWNPSIDQWNSLTSFKQDVNGSFPAGQITGVLPFAHGGTGVTSFIANLPLIGNGTSGIAQGTVSGNTTMFATVGASHINGNCAVWNSGNLIDAGAPCGTSSGGSGTVSAGTTGQFAAYPANGTTVSGVPAPVTAGTAGQLAYYPSAGATVAGAAQNCTQANTVGFVGNGSTANDTAWNAWVGSLAATNGGCLQFGVGTYLFTTASLSSVNMQVMLPLSSVSIFGMGSNLTNLKFTNAALVSALSVLFGSIQDNYHIRDFTMLTTHANLGVGINIIGCCQGFNPPMSDIQNVNIQGDDLLTPTPGAGVHYWNIGVHISTTQQTYINNLNTFGLWGAPGSAGGGVGLFFNGSTNLFATILNVTNSSFNAHKWGVELGDWWQGVTFSLCNWNLEAGQAGIEVDPGAAGTLALLNVNQSQFNTAGSQILINSPIADVLLNGNVISVFGTSGSGINGGAALSQTTIVQNVFNWTGTGANTTGIFVNGGGTGIVEGNTFTNLTTGVDLSASTAGYNVQANSYNGVTNTVINSGGAANHIGVATQ